MINPQKISKTLFLSCFSNKLKLLKSIMKNFDDMKTNNFNECKWSYFAQRSTVFLRFEIWMWQFLFKEGIGSKDSKQLVEIMLFNHISSQYRAIIRTKLLPELVNWKWNILQLTHDNPPNREAYHLRAMKINSSVSLRSPTPQFQLRSPSRSRLNLLQSARRLSVVFVAWSLSSSWA